MKPLRVYVDTSVFGGCFDTEFAEESRRFFQLVRAGQIVTPQEVRFDVEE